MYLFIFTLVKNSKTIIPLVLVVYEMMSTQPYRPGWLSIISYPMCAYGITVY